ncbi:MAG TPA: hypothetical protein DDZ99_10040 [Clostridiales bacterium]|nr:hypothetical protein [Clostridiales bacterium]
MSKRILLSKFIDSNDHKDPHIIINGINYFYDEDLLFFNLILSIKHGMCYYDIKFINTTEFSINSVNHYVHVLGFEIIDHKDDGYSIENRYEIYDYEDEIIKFYCQDILINKL